MRHQLFWIGITSILISCHCQPVKAQIIADKKALSTPSKVIFKEGKRYEIRGGSRAGQNLFHVFNRFSIPANQEAFFDQSANIQNIFARVNQGNPSKILGKLRSTGSANLFLLNPSGIQFGRRSSLDIGGSFVGTTAESIQFADGVTFKQSIAQTGTPLLSSKVPIGLNFGPKETTITHQSRANLERGNFDLLENADFKVADNQTLALLGGKIDLNGGALFVENGHIELAGIGPNQSVNFNFNQPTGGFNYSKVRVSRPIRLKNRAFVNASGVRGGSVHIYGSDLDILETSRIIASTAQRTGRPLKIELKDRLSLMDPSSALVTQTIGFARASDLDIQATHLNIEDGAKLFVRTLGTGRTGNLRVLLSGDFVMRNRLLDISAPSSPRTQLSVASGTSTGPLAQIRGVGNTGTTNIRANNLFLENSEIRFSALDSGSLGTARIEATNQLILRGELREFRSNILAQTQLNFLSSAQNSGRLNQLTIKTPHLELDNGAKISMNNLAASPPGLINISAQNLMIQKGSKIETFVRGEGVAGNDINIFSDRILIQGMGSEIVVDRRAGTQGSQGNLTIESPVLILQGDPNPDRNSEVETRAMLRVFGNTGSSINRSESNFEGGDINLNISDLLLLDHALISTQVEMNNVPGDININKGGDPGYIIAIANTNSDIRSRAFDGVGGEINIKAKGLFGFNEVMTAADRNNAMRPNNMTNDIDASANNLGVFGTINDLSEETKVLNDEKEPPSLVETKVVQQCESRQRIAEASLVSSGRGGVPHSPDHIQNRSTAWEDLRYEFALLQPSIMIDTDVVNEDTSKPDRDVARSRSETILEAQNFRQAKDGTIQLVASMTASQNVSLASQAQSCDRAHTSWQENKPQTATLTYE